MIVEAQVTINGSKAAAIWAAIANIENASETISGIESIEVLAISGNSAALAASSAKEFPPQTESTGPSTTKRWIQGGTGGLSASGLV
jgi:hypothetical protein